MCGIHALISPSTTNTSSLPEDELPPEIKQRLLARGPDHFGRVVRYASISSATINSSSSDDVGTGTCINSNTYTLRFTSSVLALRGDHVARQPLVANLASSSFSSDSSARPSNADSAAGTGLAGAESGSELRPGSGSVLCWNGEAWRVHVNSGHDGERCVRAGENDGEVVLGLLMAGIASVSSAGGAAAEDREQAVLNVLRGIEGPFAFVFFDEHAATVYFGRDRLGRRSLLSRALENGGLELCSVAGGDGKGWMEVEADGVYVLRLGTDRTPRRCGWVVGEDEGDFVSGIGRFNKSLPTGPCPPLTRDAPSVRALREQLLEALRLRVLNIPRPPDVPGSADNGDGRTRVAVLFSGGLDCTVLARLCHDVLDPEQAVDLLNVAFENPRVVAQLRKANNGGELDDFYEACPDRITGRRSFAELQRVCPGRKFRFVAINIPFTETQGHRQQVISLIYPHNTEMDLSIAYALYFAARGQGLVTENSTTPAAPYTSPARVLLSGLGADELFGGYSRHPAAFQRQGYAGLVDELLLDVGRLGKRNLGRDDRVMAHWSKEVRFPYLDERLVKWAIETPAWEKCDFEHDDAGVCDGVEPGKRVLRLLALELGMVDVAGEKKRAIQFGSRTAKMESGRVKGTTLISA